MTTEQQLAIAVVALRRMVSYDYDGFPHETAAEAFRALRKIGYDVRKAGTNP